MTLAFASIAISSWMGIEVLFFICIIVWCYSFFHVHNLRGLSEEEFQQVEEVKETV